MKAIKFPLGLVQDGGVIAKFLNLFNGNTWFTNNSNYPVTSSNEIQLESFFWNATYYKIFSEISSSR